MKLKIIHPTFFKTQPKQSSEMALKDLSNITLGKEFELHSYAYEDEQGEDFDGHIKVALKDAVIDGKNTWYIFGQHIEVVKDNLVVYPQEEQAATKQNTLTTETQTPKGFKGKQISLPGKYGVVYTDQPIIPNGSFNWGEATHDGVRIPTSEHCANIIALAKELEKARQIIGKPFRVTSFYRPDPWNAQAGGARFSTHKEGKGVDIFVEGYTGRQLGNKLRPMWKGGLGVYPGNRTHILHLDIGAYRSWGF